MNNPVRRIVSSAIIGTMLMAITWSFASEANQDKLKPISVRLAWVYDMAEVGLFVASDRGYFANEGLDVKIEPGGFGLDPIRLVASGQNDFGVAGAGNVLLARKKDIPIVAIAAEFQDTPVGFIVHKDSGISSFKDFKGKRIGVQTGADTDVLFRALMTKSGISEQELTLVPIQYDAAQFIAKQIDVLPGYITNQPITLSKKGIDVSVISAASEGLRYYGNVYFASEEMILENPKLVRSFLKAARLGWLTAILDKDAAIQALYSRAPEFERNALSDIYDAVMPFVIGDQSVENILQMSDERWRTTNKVLFDAQLLDVGTELSKSYTNIFLK